jgi:hypothetical protein
VFPGFLKEAFLLLQIKTGALFKITFIPSFFRRGLKGLRVDLNHITEYFYHKLAGVFIGNYLNAK